MVTTDNSKVPNPEGWAKWLWGFWWLRGALTAGALLSLIPSFTGFSRYEFLRAVNAFIIQWNIIAGFLGSYLGRIPFIPELSSTMVNALVLVGSIYFPLYGYGLLRIRARYKMIAKTVTFVFLSMFTFPLFTYTFYLAIKGVKVPVSRIDWYISLVILGFMVAAAGRTIVFNCLYIPGYGKGIVSVIAFILTLQIFYVLNVPKIVEDINRLSCLGAYIQEDCSS